MVTTDGVGPAGVTEIITAQDSVPRRLAILQIARWAVPQAKLILDTHATCQMGLCIDQSHRYLEIDVTTGALVSVDQPKRTNRRIDDTGDTRAGLPR